MVANNIEIFKDENGVATPVIVENEDIWVTRKQMSIIFNVGREVVSHHLKTVLSDLQNCTSTAMGCHPIVDDQGKCDSRYVRFLTTTMGNGRNILVEHFNFDVVVKVGFRVKTRNSLAFQQWATGIIREHCLNVNQETFDPEQLDLDLQDLIVLEKAKFNMGGRAAEILQELGAYDIQRSEINRTMKRLREEFLEIERKRKFLEQKSVKKELPKQEPPSEEQ